jgi:hypothetical protein
MSKEDGLKFRNDNFGGKGHFDEEEDEERWIESDWLRDCHRDAQQQKGGAGNHDDADGNEEEDDLLPDVTDLFADPDPMDSFQFTWTVNDDDDDDIHEESSSSIATTRNPTKEKKSKQRQPRTILIRLEGYKAELGQTLHSTGLTLWRASQLLSDHLVVNAKNVICGKRVVEVRTLFACCFFGWRDC